MDFVDFDALIAMIYGAVGRPEVWNEVLAAISRLMNAERAVMYIQDAAQSKILFSASYRIDPAILKIFEREYINDPMTFVALLPDAGSVAVSRQPKISQAELIESAIYRDVLKPLNIAHGSGAMTLREGSIVGVLAAMRSFEAGVFKQEEDDVLLRLTPHLSRAAQLHYRFLATELERAAAAGALDRLTHAVVICDGEARVLMANATAKRLLDARRGLRTVGGQLSGATAAQSDELVARIRAVASGERPTASVILDHDEETFRVLISGVSAELRLGLRDQANLVLVSYSDPAADLAAGVEVLKDLLKLTEAEARVAWALAHGRTLEDIAADLDVSINTVRTHVARAFGKTGTGRQADLVRHVLRTVGPFGLV